MTDEARDLIPHEHLDRPSAPTRAVRRTLERVFQNPVSTHVTWPEVLSLCRALGEVEERSDDLFVFRLGSSELSLLKPDTKFMTSPVIFKIRRFFASAGVSPDTLSAACLPKDAAEPGLIILVEREGVKIFRSALPGALGVGRSPYETNHLLHHLNRKAADPHHALDEAREDRLFDLVASAASAGGPIMVFPDAKGQARQAQRLKDYLKHHHPGAYARIVSKPCVTTT